MYTIFLVVLIITLTNKEKVAYKFVIIVFSILKIIAS